jgi:acetate kinase
MKVMVLNSGSSSIKFKLFDMPQADVIASGRAERIGEAVGTTEMEAGGRHVAVNEPIADHAAALRHILRMLSEGEDAPLEEINEVEAVGHRVVHGGERFTGTVVIDDAVVAAVEANVPLAPLHNPPNLLGIRVARAALPHACQVGVFDTAFHQSMPERAFLYGLPYELYAQKRIRRYGFHGTSHLFVCQRAGELLGRPADALNLITCHLGNGASIAAVRGGRSVDTSMGMTPLEGLVMGTRCGDVDAAIVFHLMRSEEMNVDAVDRLMNKQSGLLGLSQKSNDLRELEALWAQGDPGATRAINVFVYRIKKYIGAYVAVLGRVDAVVFTAGIGENSPFVRRLVLDGLEGLGLQLDEAANSDLRGGQAGCVTTADSPVAAWVIPTDEERLIASDTYAAATEMRR